MKSMFFKIISTTNAIQYTAHILDDKYTEIEQNPAISNNALLKIGQISSTVSLNQDTSIKHIIKHFYRLYKYEYRNLHHRYARKRFFVNELWAHFDTTPNIQKPPFRERTNAPYKLKHDLSTIKTHIQIYKSAHRKMTDYENYLKLQGLLFGGERNDKNKTDFYRLWFVDNKLDDQWKSDIKTTLEQYKAMLPLKYPLDIQLNYTQTIDSLLMMLNNPISATLYDIRTWPYEEVELYISEHTPTDMTSSEDQFIVNFAQEHLKDLKCTRANNELERIGLTWIFKNDENDWKHFRQLWFVTNSNNEEWKSTVITQLSDFQTTILPLKKPFVDAEIYEKFDRKIATLLEELQSLAMSLKYDIQTWTLSEINTFLKTKKNELYTYHAAPTTDQTPQSIAQIIQQLDALENRLHVHRITTLETVGIATCPSVNHPYENHDRTIVFKLGNAIVTVVCDGISHCDPEHGKPITGERAAHTITDQLSDHLHRTDVRHHLELLKNMTLSDASRIKDIASTMKEIIKTVLNTIAPSIVPKSSATTFEMNIRTQIGDAPFLLVFSVGDSQTLIYNAQSPTPVKQLNQFVYRKATTQPSTLVEHPRFYSHFSKKTIHPQHMSYTGGCISATGTSSMSVTLYPLDPNDIIITCSDGLTDNIADITESHSKLNHSELHNYMTPLQHSSPVEIAQHLMMYAHASHKKPDDITVCVQKV